MTKSKSVFVVLALFTMLTCSEKSQMTMVVIENGAGLVTELHFQGKNDESYVPDIKNANLVFSLEVTRSDYYMLNFGNNSLPVFLAPGDHLFISPGVFNKTDQDSFSGTGGLLNNYIREDKFFTDEVNDASDFDAIYSLPPSEFIHSIDSIYDQRSVRLERFITENNIKDELFKSTERKRIFYEASIEKNRYYRDHKFLTGEIVSLDSDFDRYLDQANFNDPTSLHLNPYRDFLFTYFERVGLEEFDSRKQVGATTVFTELSFAKAQELVTEGQTRSYVLYRIMDLHLDETPINSLGKLIGDFNKDCLNNGYKEKINTYYSKLDKLRTGKLAPDFSFPDVDGNVVSLSDFRGSLVYIDVWNSFCSPCFKEFPIIEQLISQYKDENVIFIGISFDEDEAQWKKTVERKHLEGIQLFANGWNSQFVKDYLVYVNPRFILIGKDGMFIDAKAPKPSENIEEIIGRHL